MKTLYDVQQLLKNYGTIIYMRDRLADLELMEDELKELFISQLVSTEDYRMAIFLVRQEAELERDRRKEY